MKNQNEGGFDRDIHNNIKYALNLNINSITFKNSIANSSECNTRKLILTLTIKMIDICFLTRSSKEQYMNFCDGKEMEKEKDSEIAFLI